MTAACEFIDRLCLESSTLTLDEEQLLAARVADGDVAAREALIASHYRLAAYWARKYRSSRLSYQDLFSEAITAICHAADRFDAKFGARFSSYASLWIRKRFRDALRKRTGLSRIPTNLEIMPRVVSAEEFLPFLAEEPNPDETPESLAARQEEAAALHQALAKLSPAQRRNLEHAFGLVGEPRDVGQIARDFGISDSSFHATKRRALRSLRKILEEGRNERHDQDPVARPHLEPLEGLRQG